MLGEWGTHCPSPTWDLVVVLPWPQRICTKAAPLPQTQTACSLSIALIPTQTLPQGVLTTTTVLPCRC